MFVWKSAKWGCCTPAGGFSFGPSMTSPFSLPLFCSNPDFHNQQAHAVGYPSPGSQRRQRRCILQVINMSALRWLPSLHLSTHLLATGVACGMLRWQRVHLSISKHLMACVLWLGCLCVSLSPSLSSCRHFFLPVNPLIAVKTLAVGWVD